MSSIADSVPVCPSSFSSFDDDTFNIGLSIAYLTTDLHGNEIAFALPVPECRMTDVKFVKDFLLGEELFMGCADHYGQQLLFCLFDEEMSEFLEVFALEGESESGNPTLD